MAANCRSAEFFLANRRNHFAARTSGADALSFWSAPVADEGATGEAQSWIGFELKY
jgi:hypothetical protein